MVKTETVTLSEFADEIGVSRETVARWVRLGKVKGFKRNPFNAKTAPVFIPASELARIKKLIEAQAHSQTSDN